MSVYDEASRLSAESVQAAAASVKNALSYAIGSENQKKCFTTAAVQAQMAQASATLALAQAVKDSGRGGVVVV